MLLQRPDIRLLSVKHIERQECLTAVRRADFTGYERAYAYRDSGVEPKRSFIVTDMHESGCYPGTQ